MTGWGKEIAKIGKARPFTTKDTKEHGGKTKIG
jgi:hypothetical protein